MSTYTPKIDISQFSHTNKVKSDNAYGEIQLLIEKGFVNKDAHNDEHLDSIVPVSEDL